MCHLSNYVIRDSQPLTDGYWQLEKQTTFLSSTILVVLDENGHYIGVMTRADFVKHWYLENAPSRTVGEFCNKNAKHIIYSPEYRKEALVIFADYHNINALPVIDNNGALIDIVFRQQVFYREFFHKEKLPRMHYAKQIYGSAELAKNLGYDAFSVIEFGVAGGNGLINCEFHVKEISRLFDISIEVYGFDTGKGLPESNDYRDCKYIWGTGYYPMDFELLQKRLQFAKLVIGDIKETYKAFMAEKSFAPIGTMLIDVDMYNSTVPILEMLLKDTALFLPRVHMYFDDIGGYREHLGESLAISEFNEKNLNVKIAHLLHEFSKLYCAHLFLHEKYNSPLNKMQFINLI